MHNVIFSWILALRQNYWFWPSTMTLAAVLLGFLLPYLDTRLGSDWIQSMGFIRAIQVDGARAILTTLATATLGVAGVAFSVTIVAVSFATSNYGPRLIGNFMSDRTNQVVLGIFVATFVYCITVLSTVHAQPEPAQAAQDAFVPQLSVFFALVLALTAIGALISYIHHIPESINIMNVTAQLGDKLQRSVTAMLDKEDRRREELDPVDVAAWPSGRSDEDAVILRVRTAGYLQQVDLESLTKLARKRGVQIILHRAPGEFLVPGEVIMSARPATVYDKSARSAKTDSKSARSAATDSKSARSAATDPKSARSAATDDDSLRKRMRACATQGSNRTDVQDVLFLSDQLVEVLGRALSPGINDPHTAMLCLNWLRGGLVAFAKRPPAQPARQDDPVLYRRVTFEDMLERSFDQMRQYVGADRTVTLHALGILADLAETASRQAMTDACIRQMRRLAASATELQNETAAREEIDAAHNAALQTIAAMRSREGEAPAASS